MQPRRSSIPGLELLLTIDPGELDGFSPLASCADAFLVVEGACRRGCLLLESVDITGLQDGSIC